jgi:hypothetical protein
LTILSLADLDGKAMTLKYLQVLDMTPLVQAIDIHSVEEGRPVAVAVVAVEALGVLAVTSFNFADSNEPFNSAP